MQVSVEDLSSVKKKLSVEIPESLVKRELDDAYENLKKTAKIKGFRLGKTPRGVLKGMYGKKINADVSSKLIQDSFAEAVKKSELRIIGDPQIDPPELNEKGPFRYAATVEITPEIKDLEYKGLKLKKTAYEVGEEEIETQLRMLQQQMANYVPMEEDRPIAEGDVVVVDFEGFEGGEPFSHTGMTENFPMKLGKGRVAKEFDDQLLGSKRGDSLEITVSFPEDHFNKNLAGHEISFKTTVKEIRTENLPEIDDDFSKMYASETVDDLKEKIRNNLKEGYEKRVEQELSEQIYTALLKERDFEVPDTYIEAELESIIADAERTFANSNTSMEQLGLSRQRIAEKYRETAIKQAKRHIILAKLIEQENLTVSDEELDKEMQLVSNAYGKPVEEIKAIYRQNSAQLDIFKHALLERQAVKLVMDNSIIEEVAAEAA